MRTRHRRYPNFISKDFLFLYVENLFVRGNTYVEDLILMREIKVMYVEPNMIFHIYLCVSQKRLMCVSSVS
jgi:hypothetical protein